MLTCFGCGRTINSRIARCANCHTPFHAACSAKLKVSTGGFNICCGTSCNYTPFGVANNQMRTRNFNKRRQTGGPRPGPSNQNCAKAPRLENENMVNAEAPQDPEPVVAAEADQDPDIEEIQIIETIEAPRQAVQDFTADDDDDDDIIEIIEPEAIDAVESSNVEQPVANHNEAESSERREIMVEPKKEPDGIGKVTLEKVWEGINSLHSSIATISNSLQAVSNRINTIDPRINDMENTLGNVRDQTSNYKNVETDVTGLKEEIKKLSQELTSLKSNPPNLSITSICAELKERELKSRNLIIYDVPEDNMTISEDYSTLDDINQFNNLIAARDTQRARKILETLNIDLDEISTRRIGRFNAQRCRPLVVTLSCHEDLITVFKNRHLIRQYHVKSDLTKLQQTQMRELREELEKINSEKNHPTMTIRFIRGEPTIIPLYHNRNFGNSNNSNNFKNE